MFLMAYRVKKSSAPSTLNLANRWQCKWADTWPRVAPDEEAFCINTLRTFYCFQAKRCQNVRRAEEVQVLQERATLLCHTCTACLL